MVLGGREEPFSVSPTPFDGNEEGDDDEDDDKDDKDRV